MANLFLDTIPPHEGNRDGKGRMKLAYGKPKSQKRIWQVQHGQLDRDSAVVTRLG